MKRKESLLQPPIVRWSGEANGTGGANRPAEENMATLENKTMGQLGQTGQPIQKHELGCDLSLGIPFPGDMLPGISRTEKLEGDTFPGELPRRHRRAHIVSVKQLIATVEVFPAGMPPEIMELSITLYETLSFDELPKRVVVLGGWVELRRGVDEQVKQHEDLKIRFNEGAKERKELYNKIHKLKGNIRVFYRSRPLNPVEIVEGASVAFDFEGSKDGELSVKSNVAYKKNFKFDSVFSLKQPK
nr:kinesin motor domain-containing protein [Tanacetum cinerariifolium]